MSEPAAGSDLSAIGTRIRAEGAVVVDWQKMWVAGSRYTDLFLVLRMQDNGAAFAAIPVSVPGVHLEPVPHPLGCRAAGHCHLVLDQVRILLSSVLGGGQPLPLLFTTALSYGRMSIAWGCVGIAQACLRATTEHARRREQSGVPLSRHQLVARHLAELLGSGAAIHPGVRARQPVLGRGLAGMVVAAVLAKHVSADYAARSAAAAVQVLGSAGAGDGHVAARAYRDAKLMDLIEGSNEICQLILAEHAATAEPEWCHGDLN